MIIVHIAAQLLLSVNIESINYSGTNPNTLDAVEALHLTYNNTVCIATYMFIIML